MCYAKIVSSTLAAVALVTGVAVEEWDDIGNKVVEVDNSFSAHAAEQHWYGKCTACIYKN